MITVLNDIGQRIRSRGRRDFVDVGCKPTSTAGTASPGGRADRAVHNLESVNKGKGLRVANLQGLKKYLIIVFLTLITFTTGLSQNIKFLTSSPESGSKIKSFDELTLSFDFSAVYSNLGGEEADWGVCCDSYPYDEFFPEDEQTITLFEGDPSDGVMLHQICTSIKPTHTDFKSGTDISFSFPNIQIKPDQLYTVVIT